MRPRRIGSDLVILTLIAVLMAFGCTRTNSKATDDDAPKTVRGRLMFSKSLHSLRIGDQYAYRNVDQYLYFGGKQWAPDNDKDLAQRLGGCDTTPNPDIEMLRCSGGFTEDYATTYIFRIKDDRPEIRKVDEDCGSGPTWIDNDGRWLLFSKCYYNIVTDEKILVKGMPFADDPTGSRPVQYVLGVSPDRKTVIGSYDLAPDPTDKISPVKLFVIDTESGKSEIRYASLAKYPWLRDYEQPHDDIVPPSVTQKHLRWKKDANGRDTLVEPELLGVFKRPHAVE